MAVKTKGGSAALKREHTPGSPENLRSKAMASGASLRMAGRNCVGREKAKS
jgi:hypothetical protein